MKAITIKGEHNMTKRGRCYGFTILLVFALIWEDAAETRLQIKPRMKRL
ncbi:hypothetical protein PO124_22780 [Bacillus licheniformis]|nr:hypothetical protein [Bacillus licheniformis]